MTIARPPLAKDIDDFDFDAAAVNETLVRDLAAGGFIELQRNLATIRRAALDMLRRQPSKISLKRKRLKPLMNPTFRKAVLAC